jgi:uncharacterized protein YecE (DUF72 family)
MQVWIGTSGYSYPDWVGGFYPAGVRQERMLDFYCRHFPLVELNFTFYRLPSPAMLAGLAERTPDGFQFIVKMPRTISHEESFQDVPGFRLALDELQKRKRLLGVLCQLPQAAHNVPRQRERLKRLGSEFAGQRVAVEFRHRSWCHPDVAPWLGEQGLSLVSVDVPDLPGLYPKGLVQSTPLLYVRFHSGAAENWYKSDKDRYDYDYSDAELDEWIGAIGSSTAEKVMLLFNNCQRTQAAVNAQRMRELLTKTGTEMEIMAPFATPRAAVKQRMLFE